MTWGIPFDEVSVSLEYCITGLWHPVNKNYAFKELLPAVELDKIDMEDTFIYLPSHEHNFELTTLCIFSRDFRKSHSGGNNLVLLVCAEILNILQK